jgi:AraC-like DNA-binding protein
MKYLLFTDLHMGVHNNSSVWLDASLMLAKEIVDVCFKNNITKVIFLGDFFNDRRSLNTKTISYAHEFISILKDLEVYIVIGNHDVYYRNTTDVHSMKMFNEFEHVTIVNDLLQISDKITLVSWAADWSKATTPVIMGHFEINGCLMDNRTIFENSEFDVPLFSSEMALGRTKLFHKIKGITGQTPNEFIITMKMKKAASLLTNNPEYNISDITYMLGFSSPKYFAKCFKEQFGVSPSTFRKSEEQPDETDEEGAET